MIRPAARARAQAIARGRNLRQAIVGRVALVDALGATIVIDGAAIVLPTLGLTLGPGDVVAVLREHHRLRMILSVIGAGPVPVIPAAAEGRIPTVEATYTAVPTVTGTYMAGWRTGDDLRQGADPGSQVGAAFYGQQLAGLGAVTGQAYLHLRRTGGTPGPQTPTMWLLTDRTRGSGPPTRTATTPGPALDIGETTRWLLPTDWTEQLLTGAAGGIAVYTPDLGPVIHYAGQATWAAAASLTVTYRRAP